MISGISRVIAVVLMGFSSLAMGKIAPKTAIDSNLVKIQGVGQESLRDSLKKHDVTIVQFWASWCVGCGEVMLDVAKRIKADPKLGFVSISIDDDKETAKRYFDSKSSEIKKAMDFVLLDPGGDKVASPFGIKELPSLIVMARDGKIHDKVQGHPSDDWFKKTISKARKKK